MTYYLMLFYVMCENLEFSILFTECHVKMSLTDIMGIKILFHKSL